MGHIGSKLGQISLKPCSPFQGHSFSSVFMDICQNVYYMISQSSLNMDYVGKKLGHCVKFL